MIQSIDITTTGWSLSGQSLSLPFTMFPPPYVRKNTAKNFCHHKVLESITVSPDFEFVCAVKYSSGTVGVFLRWSLRSSSLESELRWAEQMLGSCSTQPQLGS